MAVGRVPDAVVKTAGRVFEILEYFRELQAPLSVREIADHFRYPLSSTAVLVKSLTTLGYLSYDPDRRAFFPTLRIATLGEWLYDATYAGGEALRLLENVCRDTGETAILAVQNDIYSQYVHNVANPEQLIQLNVPAGTRRLLCWSGTGIAILSQLTEESVERLIERTVSRVQKDPIAARIAGLEGDPTIMKFSRENVLVLVREARKNGFAISNGLVTASAGTIAMPLPLSTNGMRLAIAAGGVSGRLMAHKAEILAAMAVHVKRYTKALGKKL